MCILFYGFKDSLKSRTPGILSQKILNIFRKYENFMVKLTS